MRFNEDLAVRPAWLPPAGAAPRHAAAAWWDAQCGAPAAPGGAARRWWARPGAADGSGAEAAAWRRSAEAALRRRVLLPALLAGALAANPAEAVAGLTGAVSHAKPRP